MKADTHEELKHDFNAFREECIQLKHLVNTHSWLFKGGEAQDKLLMNAGGGFFQELSGWMTELYILRVCRLTDPPGKAGRYNLTTQALVKRLEQLKPSLDSELAALAEINARLVGYQELLKDARNKRVAHFDLASSRSSESLGVHSQDELLRFQIDLQSFCDAVGRYIGEGPLDYGATGYDGDALSLIKHLERCAENRADAEE
ncbi:MAG: hypothetical protein V4586_00690 [Pseudomonadota bacterium]